jgi:signal transduction histidine kinase
VPPAPTPVGATELPDRGWLLAAFEAGGPWTDADYAAVSGLADALAPQVEAIAREWSERIASQLGGQFGSVTDSAHALMQINVWLLREFFAQLRERQLGQLFENNLAYNLALLRSQRPNDPELRSTLSQLYFSLETCATLIMQRARAVCAGDPQLPAMLAAYSRLALHFGNILAHAFYAVRTDELRNALRVTESLLQQLDAETLQKQQAANAARDAERHRLGRELHDGVLQEISAIKLGLEREIRRAGTPLQPELDAVMRVLQELRCIVDDLRPPDLGLVSLTDAIAAHAHLLTHTTDISVRVNVPADAPVPTWATRDIYRIVQEALANAVRHAAPRTIAVRLVPADGRPVLTVEDDGTGFAPDGVVLGGIRGMRERAAALGADLDVISAPGRGTVVRLTLPRTPQPPQATTT